MNRTGRICDSSRQNVHLGVDLEGAGAGLDRVYIPETLLLVLDRPVKVGDWMVDVR